MKRFFFAFFLLVSSLLANPFQESWEYGTYTVLVTRSGDLVDFQYTVSGYPGVGAAMLYVNTSGTSGDHERGLDGFTANGVYTRQKSLPVSQGPFYFQIVAYYDSPQTGYVIHWGDVHLVDDTKLSQSVTVAPLSGNVTVNESFPLSVTGGNTSYQWKVSPISGAHLSSTSGGNITFSSTLQGTYTVEVRAVEDVTYKASNWASSVVAVGNAKTVTVAFPENTTGFDITWEVYQFAANTKSVMDTLEFPPGFGPLIKSYNTFPLGSDKPVSVTYTVHAAGWDDIARVWEYTPGSSYTSNPAVGSPSSGGTSINVNYSGPIGQPPQAPTASSSNSTSSLPSGTTWVNGSGSGSPSSTYTGQSDATFKEGIGKLEQQLIQANTTLKQIAASSNATQAQQPTAQDITNSAQSLGQAGANLLPGALTSPGNIPSTVNPSSSSIWQVEVSSASGQTRLLDFDITHHPFFIALARFLRSLLIWGSTIFLILGLVSNTDKAIAVICAVPSTTAGPTQILGTGSSIPSALVKASLIVAVMALAVPVLYAVFLSDVGGVSIIATVFTNPVNEALSASSAESPWFTAFSEGVRILNFFIPVDYFLVCFATWWFHKFTSVTTILAVSIKIRAVAA